MAPKKYQLVGHMESERDESCSAYPSSGPEEVLALPPKLLFKKISYINLSYVFQSTKYVKYPTLSSLTVGMLSLPPDSDPSFRESVEPFFGPIIPSNMIPVTPKG